MSSSRRDGLQHHDMPRRCERSGRSHRSSCLISRVPCACAHAACPVCVCACRVPCACGQLHILKQTYAAMLEEGVVPSRSVLSYELNHSVPPTRDPNAALALRCSRRTIYRSVGGLTMPMSMCVRVPTAAGRRRNGSPRPATLRLVCARAVGGAAAVAQARRPRSLQDHERGRKPDQGRPAVVAGLAAAWPVRLATPRPARHAARASCRLGVAAAAAARVRDARRVRAALLRPGA
jgi:hypothetical protein